MGEFHQAFKGASFLADFGYTEGYKNTTIVKKSRTKISFFLEFVKNFQR